MARHESDMDINNISVKHSTDMPSASVRNIPYLDFCLFAWIKIIYAMAGDMAFRLAKGLYNARDFNYVDVLYNCSRHFDSGEGSCGDCRSVQMSLGLLRI